MSGIRDLDSEVPVVLCALHRGFIDPESGVMAPLLLPPDYQPSPWSWTRSSPGCFTGTMMTVVWLGETKNIAVSYVSLVALISYRLLFRESIPATFPQPLFLLLH